MHWIPIALTYLMTCTVTCFRKNVKLKQKRLWGQQRRGGILPRPYTVGWVEVGTSRGLLDEKVRKTADKGFLLLKGHPVHRGKKYFLNIGFMGFTRRRILHRFQKYQLTLLAKCTYKWYFIIKVKILGFSWFWVKMPVI
jgi:hypothetical protein